MRNNSFKRDGGDNLVSVKGWCFPPALFTFNRRPDGARVWLLSLLWGLTDAPEDEHSAYSRRFIVAFDLRWQPIPRLKFYNV